MSEIRTFDDFLRANQLDPSVYDTGVNLPRFIRLNSRLGANIEEVRSELTGTNVLATPLPTIYALIPPVDIAHTQVYKRAKIFGLDYPSAAAVYALDVQYV